MTSTLDSHGQHTHGAPFLASVAVGGVLAVGVLAGFTVEHLGGSAAPRAPEPPVVSYPGSSVFDNQPAGPRWTRRDDFKRPGRTVLSSTD